MTGVMCHICYVLRCIYRACYLLLKYVSYIDLSFVILMVLLVLHRLLCFLDSEIHQLSTILRLAFLLNELALCRLGFACRPASAVCTRLTCQSAHKLK